MIADHRRYGLRSAWNRAPSHYLNQWWIIVNWTHRNKLQLYLNQKTRLFIHEMHLKHRLRNGDHFFFKLYEPSSSKHSSTYMYIYLSHCNTNAHIISFMHDIPWWRQQMETFSALLDICAGNWLVTGEFLAQRPVTRSFVVFFDLRLNKRLSKQSRGWWFETPSH